MRWSAFLLLAACNLNAWSDSDGGDTDEPVVCEIDACDGQCVDLDNDPQNCGMCGRTCVVARGEASCDLGECTLATCASGWADCDGQLGTGCETEDTCETGAACESSCGTVGASVCDDVCEPTCEPPVEVCNLQDDDCDGVCDNGGGCHRGVHRSVGSLGHLYGNDLAELQRHGQRIEVENYFYLYDQPADGLKPLFRCLKGNGKRFLTTSTNCELGRTPEFTLGYVAPRPACGAVPLYRLYSGAQGDHFYTTSAAERDNAVASYGYKYEAVAGYIWTGR